MTLIEQIKDLINRVENARGFDGSEGKWVTIKGTHVFIPDGKSVEEVMEEKGWGSEKGTEKKESKKSYVPDKGEDSPRHIYGKKEKGSIPVATKVTNYPNWNKVEIVKEFDDEETALDYAEERGEKVKSDYINKTKEAEKYGLVEWMKPKTLDFVKKHGYYPEESDLSTPETPKGGKKEDYKSYYESEYKEALKEIAEGKDYAQINYHTTPQEMKMALSFLKKHESDWDKYDIDTNIKEYEDLSDDWNKEQIGRIAREKAAQETLKKWIKEGKDRKNEYYKIYEPEKYKKPTKADNSLADTFCEALAEVLVEE